MSEKFTPGPWTITHDPDGGSDDYCIGVVGGKVDQVAVCSKRDAQIIAAAPDMHTALKATARELKCCADQLAALGYESKDGGSVMTALSDARVALAKAAP